MGTYSILIVDDEPDNFDAIEALLPNESYQLHYASNGENAIAALDKFDPDVILLDVMMPGINGIDVCKRIKLMSKWQAVPIIMVTALSSKEDLARCLAAGANDFLSKPLHGLELRARVNSMLRIKKQHDRLSSLAQLQRNNINFLTNSLSEMRLDLAIGFPSEFNSPLNALADNIDYLSQKNDSPYLEAKIKSSGEFTAKLQRLTEKFWFYLQLILDHSAPKEREISDPQAIVRQLLEAQLAESVLPQDIDCEIEQSLLAVDSTRAHWIFSELIEYIFALDLPDLCVTINGQVIDNSFHFSLSASSKSTVSESKLRMSDLIEFNPWAEESQELGIGLKIVKKLVEIYDGIFLMSGEGSSYLTLESSPEKTIYITLPLLT